MSRIKYITLYINYLILTLLTVFAAFIYFIYRENDVIFNQILSTFGAESLIEKHEIQSLIPLPNWVIYSLPGGIWVFVLTIIFRRVYRNRITPLLPMDYLPMLYAIGLEFLQYFHITDGTFDKIDLMIILAAGFLARIFDFKQISTEYRFMAKVHYLVAFSGFLVLFLSDVRH